MSYVESPFVDRCRTTLHVVDLCVCTRVCGAMEIVDNTKVESPGAYSAGRTAFRSPSNRNTLDPPGVAGRRDKTGDHGSLPCDQGARVDGGGQPCLWWSQGCTIGCETCTGVLKGPGRYCNGTLQPTLPKWAWTMNGPSLQSRDTGCSLLCHLPLTYVPCLRLGPRSGRQGLGGSQGQGHLPVLPVARARHGSPTMPALPFCCSPPSRVHRGFPIGTDRGPGGTANRAAAYPLGMAPVADPCGMAGGTRVQAGGGGAFISSAVPISWTRVE